MMPTRIVVDKDGYARRPQSGDVYDVVFIRNDGWSLAAPDRFRSVAHAMWASEWAKSVECPGTVVT